MPAVLLKLLATAGSLLGFAVNQTVQWVKQEAMRLARAARALAVWVASFLASKAALAAAAIIAWETFAILLVHNFIVPITSGTIALFIPEGSAGDGFVWLLWDTGLNLKVAYETLVLYLVNYTALWKAFSVWMKSLNLAISAYWSAQKTADAIRASSV